MAPHDVPRAQPPPTVYRPKKPSSTVHINRKDSYVGDETQSKTIRYPAEPSCWFERCKFDNACWRPLCPYKHSDGATRATHLSQIWALLAKQETLMAPNKGASNNTTDMVADTTHLAGEARHLRPRSTVPRQNPNSLQQSQSLVLKFGLLGLYSTVPRQNPTSQSVLSKAVPGEWSRLL